MEWEILLLAMGRGIVWFLLLFLVSLIAFALLRSRRWYYRLWIPLVLFMGVLIGFGWFAWLMPPPPMPNCPGPLLQFIFALALIILPPAPLIALLIARPLPTAWRDSWLRLVVAGSVIVTIVASLLLFYFYRSYICGR